MGKGHLGADDTYTPRDPYTTPSPTHICLDLLLWRDRRDHPVADDPITAVMTINVDQHRPRWRPLGADDFR